MAKYRKLSHVVYKCEYHLVFTPKYRFKILTGAIKDLLEHDIRAICSWKEVEIIEMNIQIDHVHMYISIPPKISVSDFLGILKGKTAIKMFKSYPNLKKKPYWGNHFWSRGYFINTVGMDADLVQRYVKYQEDEEKRQENESNDFTLF
jgi:putative transposase